PAGAMCVQRFDDSLNSAIHITYRISLRSSSMPEPRDPLLKVLIIVFRLRDTLIKTRVWNLRRLFRKKTAEATTEVCSQGLEFCNSIMIPPLVHQRRPCYDFYFL